MAEAPPPPSTNPVSVIVSLPVTITKAVVSSTTTSKEFVKRVIVKPFSEQLAIRLRDDPKIKLFLLGGTGYIIARLLNIEFVSFGPLKKLFEFCYRHIHIPDGWVMCAGDVEPDVPFGRLGYTRCLEADQEVMEKYGIPMNAEKCLRDGIHYTPGEIYQKFDLNEYDPKNTPLAWTYAPISDPTIILPTCWYNDMSGENQVFELFKRSLRILGYLPSEAYEHLYKYCKILLLNTNQHLIRVGDSDDKLYIVVTGAIDVYTQRIGPYNDFILLKTTQQGGQIMSLFSLIDVITGNSKIIKSVYAVSKLDTTKVLVFPIGALKDYLIRNQEYLVPSVIRLLERGYRFQYQILHKALQLTSETTLVDIKPIYDPPSVIIPPEGVELSSNIKERAVRSLMEFLDIDDIEFLTENCNVAVYEEETESTDTNTIKNFKMNHVDAAYKYVFAGKLQHFHVKSSLNIMDQLARKKHFPEKFIVEVLCKILPGEGTGGVSGILGYKAIFCRVQERSIIVTMSKESLEKLFEKYPMSILPIANMTVYRMSGFSRAVDFAMEWITAKEGQYIYHKEQLCHASYLMIRGRARAYQLETEATHRAIMEYRENNWIGLIEALLQSKRRRKTCVVIRESELAKIPNALVRNIVINYTAAAQVMLNFLVQRSHRSRKFEMNDIDIETDHATYKESRRTRSIALIPAAEGIPYAVLAVEIKRHYLKIGTCVILTFERLLKDLRVSDISPKDQFKLEMYTLKFLETYDMVIFICIPKVHYWNHVCSSHAEVVFTVCTSELPNISTRPTEYEEDAIGKKISTRRKELIILHKMDRVLPRNTKEWLFCRDWVAFHHHIRLPIEAFDILGAMPEEEIMVKYHASLYREIEITSDLSRFHRWLIGKTFGVLCSSGGARIGTQLGMLQALLEYQHIPIDLMIGSGAGFVVAVCYAIYQDYAKVQEIVEKIFKDFGQLLKLHWDDFTIPWISMSQGKRLLVYFSELFGSIQLEDTWIPVCCTTTNLTSQDVRIERSGPVWVYVRASLSHLNHSPPICDPVDGDYICDGAHANSLPEDILKEFGAEYIIAFNTVGGKLKDLPKQDPNAYIIQFFQKAVRTFFKRFGLANPFFETVFNQLAVTQTKMYAAGCEAISNLKYVVYVRPPVEHLASQEWKNLPSLHRVGYFYMKAILDKNPYTEEIPFYVYWANVKNTSTDIANEGGREIQLFKL